MSKGFAILVFRVLAGVATIGLASSPSLLMYRIYKQKHVGVTSVVPLASLLGSSHIWMVYGYLTKNYFPLVSCFLYGECCAIVYLSIYCYYSTDKQCVFRVLAAVLTIVAFVTIYAIVGSLGYTGQSTSSINTTMGLIADCGGVFLYGAPMEKLFQVLKHKSAVFINVHMVIAGLASNLLWLTYGVLITNPFIMSLNALFLTINVFTLLVYRLYDPHTHPLVDDSISDDITVCIEILSPVYTTTSSPLAAK
ncbi:Bidirectional sugar transporter NEC1 [Phytophthora nicotianae]|uniref:Bidirectional sugar transporter NEC1 n=1 Tax=Phytophthora nicotianae TaxID=4792 RepID=A0A0W8CPP0_PHYNI|nr:Bidirectional sugar transporter NEC1 [Phytophthora nicotianae]